MGLAVSIFIAPQMQPRRLLGSAVLSTFTILMAFDLLAGFLSRSITIEYIFLNFVGNVVGSAFVAILIVAIFTIVDSCLRYTAIPLRYERLIAGAAIANAGMIISMMAFYSTDYFFKPVAVMMDVQLDYPLSASVSRVPHLNEGQKPFRLIEAPIHANEARWVAPNSDLNVSWQAAGSKYTATLGFYNDCIDPSKLPDPKDPLIIKDITRLSVWFENGYTDFSLIGGQNAEVAVSAGSNVKFFWFTRDKPGESIHIQQFTKDAPVLKHIAFGQHSFYLYAPHHERKNQAETRPRKLNIKADDRLFSLDLPATNVARADTLTCISTSAHDKLDGTKSLPNEYIGYLAGISVSISDNQPSSLFDRESETVLSVSGEDGFITVGGIDPASLARNESGYTDFLVFHGNATHMEVDDTPIAANAINAYAALGLFYVHFDDDGRMRATGPADAMWRDHKRMNPTKWERLTDTYRLAAGSFIITTVAPIFGMVLARIRRNKPFKWLKLT
jgi:hypothetical protein